MPLQNKIVRAEYGNPVTKIPVIVAMIDSDGAIKEIPFSSMPFNDYEQAALAEAGVTDTNKETIYGLELMINPASLSTNLSKIINRSQTMTSFVEDHWGEEIDTITLQGMTAAFVTGSTDVYSMRLNSNTNSPTKKYLESTNGTVQGVRGYGSGIHDDEIGLTTSQRRKSVSYRHFKRLLDLFRVNGCFFDTFGLISKRYSIMISYGREAYSGYFESLDVTEIAENPFRFQYTITFKSQQTIYSYIKQPSIRPGSFNSPSNNYSSSSSTASN
jgi:hypothetical protein